MANTILIGSPPIEVLLRQSARARRLSLRISGADGRVSLTVPRGITQSDATQFASEKESWLREHLEKVPDLVAVGEGTVMPVEGIDRQIVRTDVKRVELRPGELLVPERSRSFRGALLGYLKTRARDRLAESSERYAAQVGRDVKRLTIRDTRSRWGSCTSDGNLMYSWRLILAPSLVLDYVAAHEVAHLVELNHSRAFWGLVEDLMPGYRQPRHWLKAHGSSLHRFQFQT